MSNVHPLQKPQTEEQREAAADVVLTALQHQDAVDKVTRCKQALWEAKQEEKLAKVTAARLQARAAGIRT